MSARRPTLCMLAGFFLLATGLQAVIEQFPGKPSALEAVLVPSTSNIQLTWNAPSVQTGQEPTVSYRIYKKDPDTGTWGSPVGSTSSLTWIHTGIDTNPYVSHEYTVVAVDADGEQGAQSESAYYARQRFDFVLSWDADMPANATPNLKAKNTAIVGTTKDHNTRRIYKDNEGNFRVGNALNGNKIRFVGVNLSAAACFPAVNNTSTPTSGDAIAIARRMAQFGINLVRIHQIDQAKPRGVFTDSTLQTFDPAQMARLAFLVKQLKLNGIYVDMNLRVLMKYPNPNGGPMELFKGVDIFSENHLWQRQKDYAEDLLRYNNSQHVPDVGTYAEDPAVALVEISNEDGLIKEWIDGDIDALSTLSSTLHAELTTHWNDWLIEKYQDDSLLSAAWSPAVAPASPYGTEVLDAATRSNTGALSGLWWKQIQNTANTAAWVTGSTVGLASGNAIKIDVSAPNTAETWRVQVFCGPLTLNPQLPYTLRFQGRTAAGERDFNVAYRDQYGNVVLGRATFRLTPQWQNFTVVLPPAPAGMHLAFTSFARTAGISYLGGFSVTAGDALMGATAFQPEFAGPTSVNILTNDANPYNCTPFTTGTPSASWEFYPNDNQAVCLFQSNGRSVEPAINSIKVHRNSGSTASTANVNLLRRFYTELQYGKSYELTFDVKASTTIDFTTNGQMHTSQFAIYKSSTFVASNSWATKKHTFTVNQDNDANTLTPNVPSRFTFGLGKLPAGQTIEFANISLRELPGNVFNTANPSLPHNFPTQGTLGGQGYALYEYYEGSNAPTHQYVANGRASSINSLRVTAPGDTSSLTKSGAEKLLLVRNTNALIFGKSYQLTFDVRANQTVTFSANAQGNTTGFWPVFGSRTLQATTDWTTQQVSFTLSEDDNPSDSTVTARITFGIGGIAPGNHIEFANVSVREGGLHGLPGNESLANKSVSIVPYEGIKNRYRQVQTDWLRFLWEREIKYWSHMREHVKKPLASGGLIGAQALTIGTQGEYSPTLIQDAAGFDVIDAHGYWCHPQELNTSAWHIVNKSMMTTADADIAGTTIPRRAGARIIGKPYLLSEYNQAGPSTYGSEAFPLMGAYAAHQGWAGVVAFDYENQYNETTGVIGWNAGREGMFSIGQAPAKMITIPALRVMLDQAGVETTYNGTTAGTAFAVVHDAVAIEMLRQRLAVDINAVNFGIDSRFAYTMPIGLKRPEWIENGNSDYQETSYRSMPQDAPSAPYATAATQDVTWDSTNQRVLVKGRLTKAALGNLPTAGNVILDDGVTITSTASKLQGTNANYANFVLTRMDGDVSKTFGQNGTKWLLSTAGYSDNHLVKWKPNMGPTATRSAVEKWGVTPTLLERIGGSLTFTVPGGCYLHARALNELGAHFETLTVSDPGAGIYPSRTVTVTLPTHTLTPWYEMYVTTSPTP